MGRLEAFWNKPSSSCQNSVLEDMGEPSNLRIMIKEGRVRGRVRTVRSQGRWLEAEAETQEWKDLLHAARTEDLKSLYDVGLRSRCISASARVQELSHQGTLWGQICLGLASQLKAVRMPSKSSVTSHCK